MRCTIAIEGIVQGVVQSMDDAVEWLKRCPNPHGEETEVEIRPVFEAADFGAEYTPELREQEQRIRRREPESIRNFEDAIPLCDRLEETRRWARKGVRYRRRSRIPFKTSAPLCCSSRAA